MYSLRPWVECVGPPPHRIDRANSPVRQLTSRCLSQRLWSIRTVPVRFLHRVYGRDHLAPSVGSRTLHHLISVKREDKCIDLAVALIGYPQLSSGCAFIHAEFDGDEVGHLALRSYAIPH